MNEPNHIFLSYSHRDSQIATELASRLRDAGLRCFLAERDISATQQWEPRLRDELRIVQCVLILLTPRSRDSAWVAIEAGPAWVLEKNIVPATMFVEPHELTEPMRAYQVCPVETNAQITTLIQGLQRNLLNSDTGAAPTPTPPVRHEINRESFCERGSWERLQKIGDWQIDEESRVFHGEGVHNYLLSHLTYGERPFLISARLRFASLQPRNAIAAVNAGIVFGWRAVGDVRRYYNLMFTGTRLLLEVVGDRGGTVFRDFQHIDEGVPFAIEPERYFNVALSVRNTRLAVTIDDAQTYKTTFSSDPVGRVGVRPWRSRIESDRFDVHEEK